MRVPGVHFKHSFSLSLPLVGAVFCSTVSLPAQTSIFSGPRDYVVGAYPESVVVADFNGDGRPDIATANQGSDNVSVLLQNSDGTFQTAVNYAAGNGPVSLQVGDFNNDGKLDLLVLNATDNTIGVLLGNGNGTFQPETVTAIPGSPLPFVALGDFNGDSKLDVAIVVPLPAVGTFGAAIMLGKGDGTFQSPSKTFTLGDQPVALAAVDINQDSKMDLLTVGSGSATLSGAVSALLGKGDGTFQAPITTSYSISDGPIVGLVVADFNLDGNLDVATSANYGLNVLLGNGDGTFQGPPTSFPYGVPLAAGDFRGGGKQDLMASTGIFLNNGDATFDQGQAIVGGAAALSDLTGSGKLDVVITHSGTHGIGIALADTVSVVSGNGNGSFATPPQYGGNVSVHPIPPPTLTTLAAADFNNDGKIDLDVGLYTGDELSALYLNNGAGFSAPEIISVGPEAAPYVIASDFNSDGRMDLAVADGQGVAIFLGNGDGTFQGEAHYGAGMYGPIAAGDFNHDGKLDLLGVSSGKLSVLLGNGDATFGFPLNSATGAYAVTDITVGQFNGDTNPDVAALVQATPTAAAQLGLFFGNGDGTFSPGPTYNVGPNPTAIASGDFNGDGIPDIVVGNSDSGASTPSSIVILLGNGDGTFKSPVATVAGNRISAMAVADFNNDGKQDIVIANSGWNDIALLLGNGDGTFQASMQFYLNNQLTTPPVGLAIADFDGDGKPDVAVAGVANISVLPSRGLPGAAALVSPASISFGHVDAGYTSPEQFATLSNSGSDNLNISNIAITGPQNGDFQETNACGATLAPGATCGFDITFTPKVAGARSASIQITDNAISSAQTISLSGNGLDFSMSASSPNQTVSAGQTATYNLTVSPEGGFNQTVKTSCAGAPAMSTCIVSPSSFTLNGSASQSVTVTLTTNSAGTSPLFSAKPPSIDTFVTLAYSFATAMLLTLLLSILGSQKANRRGLCGITFSSLLGIAIALTACGGDGGGGGGGGGSGIQPGTYNFTVTGNYTSGSVSLTHNTKLSVTVQ